MVKIMGIHHPGIFTLIVPVCCWKGCLKNIAHSSEAENIEFLFNHHSFIRWLLTAIRKKINVFLVIITFSRPKHGIISLTRQHNWTFCCPDKKKLFFSLSRQKNPFFIVQTKRNSLFVVQTKRKRYVKLISFFKWQFKATVHSSSHNRGENYDTLVIISW